MPKIKDENKIKAIQQAAMKLVIKTGFVGLKMADVAVEAGMATGTLYIYYKSKEELINEVFIQTKKEIAEVILHPTHQSDTFFKTLQKMWLAYFAFCNNNFEKMLFVEQFFYSGYIKDHIMAEAEAYFNPLNTFLLQAQEQGLVKQLHVELMKAQVQGSVHEIIKVARQQKVKLSKEIISQCFDMAWNSIRA